MPLTDAAPMIAGHGYILTAASLTATQPTQVDIDAFVDDTTVLPAGFTCLGHTDLDNVVTFQQDAGDTTVKGSWQTASLREVITAEAIDSYTVSSLQIVDNDVLSLYHGGGDATVAGEFSLPDSPTPTERAAVLIFVDGTDALGFYTPKVSILRDDAIAVAADDFMKVPLRFTILQKTGAKKAKWIHADLGA